LRETEYEMRLANFDAEVRPWNIQLPQWEMRMNEKKEALRVEYVGKGLKLGAPEPVMAVAGIKMTLTDIETYITEELDVEFASFKIFRATVKAGQFGNPLYGEDNVKRHEFWPAYSKRWPLHNFCAEVLLGGAAAATENERFHSLLGYIMSKLRARLTVETLERLALNKHFLMKRYKATFAAAKTAEEMAEKYEELLAED